MSLTNSNKTINTLYKESTRHGSNPLITGHSSASIMSGSADSGSNDGNRFTSISMRESLSSNLSGKVIRDSLSTQDVTDERETDGFGGDNNRSNAFERDMQEGFTSNNFDLSENVEAEDQRAGLVDSEKVWNKAHFH
ncbi:hypothetical protein SARC_15602 [Sphaeroforma arctica JP610]|uniref:Uncharacterized protein n=1 Tax=Sphaeroforma arctica JP610 TaxID=667725 RepID=A0A0L0F565_9EUKA|nr:hypothetical protein SARC_15602 [Sphaeroforma arctica JP610]KNC71855.1 hypothetical protein SARC_15602 [Sphaeroforma arctica JP610]|eukprot:XP_014145757.1 hypothetical protein SARC_15602 [Sphaeroforma arctica JP610]